MLKGNVAAILDRAGKDFEIPGIKKREEQVALVKFSMEGPWMSEGKQNFLRNVPELWAKAGDEIEKAGIASVPNIEALYTNKYIDVALKA
jgi:hypothetical protein